MIGTTLVILSASVSSPVTVYADASHEQFVALSTPSLSAETAHDADELSPTSTSEALIRALRQPTIPHPELYHLLLEAEQIRVSDLQQREELRSLLLRHARQLRDNDDATSEPLLWSALRRFSSLAAPEQAIALAEFLRPSDRANVRQSALLGLYSILELRSLADDADSALLRLRLTELARKYLDPDWLVSGQNSAIALAAFTAAALADVPDGLQLAHQLRSLKRDRLLRRAIEKLEAACASRQRRSLNVPETLLRVVATLRGSSSP